MPGHHSRKRHRDHRGTVARVHHARRRTHPPPGGWTVDHLDAWPESHIRYELTDGALTIGPTFSSVHQTTVALIAHAVTRQAPEPIAAIHAMEIRFAQRLTRIADVVVARINDPHRNWFAPGDVLLAIEVESPGSHVEERVTKPALYARFGIPHFWRIETEPLRILTHRLGGDRYVLEERASRVRLDEPFPLDVDLDAILPAWARD